MRARGWHCAKHFAWIFSFNSHLTLTMFFWKRYFTDDEVKAQVSQATYSRAHSKKEDGLTPEPQSALPPSKRALGLRPLLKSSAVPQLCHSFDVVATKITSTGHPVFFKYRMPRHPRYSLLMSINPLLLHSVPRSSCQ